MSNNLRFDCIVDKNYRPSLGDFITRVAVRLSISDLAETLPLNLCLLIDKSLSMQGHKMEAALTSARQLIYGLRPEDQLSLLAFSTTTDVLLANQPMDAIGQRLAEESLLQITPRGVTRLDLALGEAYSRLRNSEDFVNIVLLLSDGAPTDPKGYILEGSDLDTLRQSISDGLRFDSVVTSTIGLGDAADCLAPFLESCAETGQGVFYHSGDPHGLADRFLEELNRVKATAISDTKIQLSNLAGSVRKAAAIHPDLRELDLLPDPDGGLTLNVGALQKGEEHVFLLELVTSGSGEAARKKLCDVTVSYRAEGKDFQNCGQAPILEFTDDESLLTKPGHSDVEKYKALYMAYQQTRFAAQNVRSGGDAKKTKVLLEAAAKTTRRLGMAKQTKLLIAMADSLDGNGTLSENQLAEIATTTRKTKVLSASQS